VYTARAWPCTRSVYTGRKKCRVYGQNVNTPVNVNVNTPVYRVHGPCTAVYPIRSRSYTAVYTGRKDDRVHGTRPCTWPCSDHVRPCTGSVHAVNSRVQGRKHTRVQGTRPWSGHKRTMFTARERPCTRPLRRATAMDMGRKHARVHDHRVRAVTRPCSGHRRTMYTVLARRCIGSVHGRGHVRRGHGHVNGPCTTGTQTVYMPCLRPVPVFTDTGRNGVNGPRCRRPVDELYTTEAEAKAEIDVRAEAKVIITRPRPAIFVYNSGSTDLLGQRDLLRSFETANYLIPRFLTYSGSRPACH